MPSWPEWMQSKTLLFGLLALAVMLAMFTVALAVYLITGESLPFMRDFLESILGLFGINSARNVVTDGIMKRNGNSNPPPGGTPSFTPPGS